MPSLQDRETIAAIFFFTTLTFSPRAVLCAFCREQEK